MNYLEGLVRARRIDFSMGHGYDMNMAWVWLYYGSEGYRELEDGMDGVGVEPSGVNFV